MKQPVFVLVSLLIACAACNTRKVAPMSEARKQQIIDSIVHAREQEIIESERESLRDRMSIELKVKADSLLALRKPAIIPPAGKPDTTNIDTTKVKPSPGMMIPLPDSAGKLR